MADIDIDVDVDAIELEILRKQVASIRELAEHLRPYAPVTAGLIDLRLQDPS